MNYKKLLTSTIVAGVFATSSFSMSNNKVYVTVNGDTIKASDIAVVLKDPRINFESLPQKDKDEVLQQLIDKKLLAQEALNSDVVKDPMYTKTLEDTIHSLKQDLALQMWIQKESAQISVSPNEVEDFYNKNKAKMVQPKMYNAKHILVKTEQEAKGIISQLNGSKNLEKDFIELAKEKSTGPSGKKGGDLGWFEAKQMVPEFSLATSFLKKGEITKKPVKTQFGYHVIYLVDIKEAKNVDLESVRSDIQKMLMQEKFSKKIESILQNKKQKAKITFTK